jgi:hypothetical protein
MRKHRGANISLIRVAIVLSNNYVLSYNITQYYFVILIILAMLVLRKLLLVRTGIFVSR